MLKNRFATLLWSDIHKPTFLLLPFWSMCSRLCLGWALLHFQIHLAFSTRELKRSFQKLKRNWKCQEPKSGWQSKSHLSSGSLTQTTLRDSHWEAVWHGSAARDTHGAHIWVMLSAYTTSKASTESLLALFPLFPRDSAPLSFPTPKKPNYQFECSTLLGENECHLQRQTICDLIICRFLRL